jgi:hypothetical protein
MLSRITQKMKEQLSEQHHHLSLRNIILSLPILLALTTFISIIAIFVIAFTVQPHCFANKPNCEKLTFGKYLPTISEAGGYYPASIVFSYGLCTVACLMFVVMILEWSIIQLQLKQIRVSHRLKQGIIGVLYFLSGTVACGCLGILSVVSMYVYGDAHNTISVIYFIAILVYCILVTILDLYYYWRMRSVLKNERLISESTDILYIQQQQPDELLFPLWTIALRVIIVFIMFVCLFGLILSFFLIESKKLQNQRRAFLSALSVFEYVYVLGTILYFVTYVRNFFTFGEINVQYHLKNK